MRGGGGSNKVVSRTEPKKVAKMVAKKNKKERKGADRVVEAPSDHMSSL